MHRISGIRLLDWSDVRPAGYLANQYPVQSVHPYILDQIRFFIFHDRHKHTGISTQAITTQYSTFYGLHCKTRDSWWVHCCLKVAIGFTKRENTEHKNILYTVWYIFTFSGSLFASLREAKENRFELCGFYWHCAISEIWDKPVPYL
jgi:hypothetical protein